MSQFSAIHREAAFLLRDRAFLFWMVIVLALSGLSVGSGMSEVRHQKTSIEQLVRADQQQRSAVLAEQQDWGSAAYYSFHLTYQPPSNLAFAAMGQRDQIPWKHRIRMLALEGQIYESDAGNPELALIGRFDFTFLVAFALPFILIILLHDLRAGERSAGRLELLVATAANGASIWWLRTILRTAATYICLITPLLIGGWLSATSIVTLISASAIVLAYTLFWALVCFGLATWRQPGPVILTGLIGVWMLVAVIIPAGGRMTIDRLIPVPSGADIVMTQREAVNDAWDLPKALTMQAFFERHPQWSNYGKIEKPFEWKWYFAFQQVGDQQAEPLANAYYEGRIARDQMAARLALIAPPVLVERSLQQLAGTDTVSLLAYEQAVRNFHAQLRDFYYPKLFRNEPFEKTLLDQLPRYPL